MPSTAICWTRPHAALAAAMIFLTACAGVVSDAPPSACPPVVDYGRAEQRQVAEEIEALPEGAVIIEWLADLAVLRNQVRACLDNIRFGHFMYSKEFRGHSLSGRKRLRLTKDYCSLICSHYLEADVEKIELMRWIPPPSRT